jgi:hypothetical protein
LGGRILAYKRKRLILPVANQEEKPFVLYEIK